MNLKSVVVIPTFARPEFLALALEKVNATNNAPDDVRIFLDTCSDERMDETEYVRDTYLPTAEIFRAGLHVISIGGSWNILNSLKQGCLTGAEYVFFIEEDVMVKPDFFDRHYQMQAEDDYFVTCGRKLRNRDENYYSNPGTCYRHEKLETVLPSGWSDRAASIIWSRYQSRPLGVVSVCFGIAAFLPLFLSPNCLLTVPAPTLIAGVTSHCA